MKEVFYLSVKEKTAYLSGLMSGLAFDPKSKEGKMFAGILEALEEIADQIEDIADELDDLQEFVEAMDEDLDDLENALDFDDEDDEDDEDEEDNETISVKCAVCDTLNVFNPDVLWSEGGDPDTETDVLCSKCGNVVFSSDMDWAEDDDDNEDDEDDEDDDVDSPAIIETDDDDFEDENV